MTHEEIRAAVEALRWYHEIEVCPGVVTKPVARFSAWELIEAGIAGMDLQGKRVLDIGTRDGKWAFAAERKGASVVGIDNDPSAGAQLLKEVFRSSVVFEAGSIYDLSPISECDVVFLFGVLYHLRYPMLGLRRACDRVKPGGRLYIEAGMLDDYHDLPILACPVRTSPYEVTSCSFFNMEGLTETLWSFGFTVTGSRTLPSENGARFRRYWVEATKTHEMPSGLAGYWEGFHRSHTGS